MCCICYEKNLALAKGGKSNAVRMTCCGALFCDSCNEGIEKKARETPNKEQTLVLCLCVNYPESDEEIFERYMKHAKEGRAWAMEHAGLSYYKGKGTNQSYTKAFEY